MNRIAIPSLVSLIIFAALGCAPTVTVDGDSEVGGSGPGAETPARPVVLVSPPPVCDGTGGGSDAGTGGAGGSAGACGDDALAACKATGDACVPGSDCYDFKACYEDVQTDPAAVQACVDADPAGADAWAALVACECACGWAPPLFCDGSRFGHPNG